MSFKFRQVLSSTAFLLTLLSTSLSLYAMSSGGLNDPAPSGEEVQEKLVRMAEDI